MINKCVECGKNLPENSEEDYCPRCDEMLDKKFDDIESNLIVYKELADHEIEILNKFDKEDIIDLYIRLFDSYREDGDLDGYECALLNRLQELFSLTVDEIGADRIAQLDESKAGKKSKKTECAKCAKPVLQDDFVFCPYCGDHLGS